MRRKNEKTDQKFGFLEEKYVAMYLSDFFPNPFFGRKILKMKNHAQKVLFVHFQENVQKVKKKITF